MWNGETWSLPFPKALQVVWHPAIGSALCPEHSSAAHSRGLGWLTLILTSQLRAHLPQRVFPFICWAAPRLPWGECTTVRGLVRMVTPGEPQLAHRERRILTDHPHSQGWMHGLCLATAVLSSGTHQMEETAEGFLFFILLALATVSAIRPFLQFPFLSAPILSCLFFCWFPSWF